MKPDDRYVLISADCHAGANHEAYRDYLEAKYLDDFDAWRERYRNPFKDLTTGHGPQLGRRAADRGSSRTTVWSPRSCSRTRSRRSSPPVPSSRASRDREEYELRLAGVRAHNRWLADWCASAPERRAGIGQIFLNDLDDTLDDVRWCHEHGLRGGVLLQPVPDDLPHLDPLFSERYDPLWALCEELGVVVNTHSGGAGMPDYGRHRAAARRGRRSHVLLTPPLTHMLIGGAFERFPELRFVVTETGCSWIPAVLEQLDTFHRQMRTTGRIGELRYDPDDVPPLSPSEYFARNCWVGVSFPSPAEAMTRHVIGAAASCGAATTPTTNRRSRTHARGSGARSPAPTPLELQQLLAGNAATVYGFDLDALAPLAARCGPTVEELAVPYEGVPEENRSPAFVKA